MTGSSDDLSIDRVKAVIQKKRVDSGVLPVASPSHSTPASDDTATESSDEIDSEKVRAALRQTRACAIRNAQSCESLKEAQSATPGRGIPTSKFRTRGASPPSGAPQAHSGDAKQQKKEKS